jgi:DNA-binding NarL/FixJ family response regulator
MGNTLLQAPARILIADDSSSLRSTLKKTLEAHSKLWKVCAEASNGEEAVQMAVKSKPDLAIIDLQMPVLDGLTASARIAKSLPRIPILINTVYTSAYVDSEARNAGVREVISKADPGRLLRAIESLLSKNSPPQ